MLSNEVEVAKMRHPPRPKRKLKLHYRQPPLLLYQRAAAAAAAAPADVDALHPLHW